MITPILSAAVALLSAGAVLATTTREPSPTTLIAHRGESVDAPENTLPAYRMAVDRGFGFECDIYLSKDGRLFTFHDSNLTRTTSGANTNRCTNVDWEGTISKLNVGGWDKWKGSSFDPTRPALLSEVLALARDGRLIYVEVKDNDPTWVPYIKAEVEKAKNVNPGNVLFISFGAKLLAELKRQLPQYRAYFLLSHNKSKGRPWTADEVIERLRAIGADGIDMHFEPTVHDAAFVKKIKDAGFSFHVWTVDDLWKAKQAFAAGADTLTTNCAKTLLDCYEADADSLRAKIAAKHRVHVADEWGGGRRTIFDFNGRRAWVVEPAAGVPRAAGCPWVWTMQWMGAYMERTGAPTLVRKGFCHVHLEAHDLRASAEGLKAFAAFQDYLVGELGLAPKANLIGMSWGGFYSVRYAAAHPDKVAKIYLDAPLLTFQGFPRGATPDVASRKIGPWAKDAPPDGNWLDDPRMPVNLAANLARANIPIYLLYGGQDQTVDPKVNCELFANRFKAAGGKIQVENRPCYGHHPHGFETCDIHKIAAFFAQ